jgi:UDP-N-acetyl-D-mannosaminuronic acid transferase (WecB/TagA/CpsF family)
MPALAVGAAFAFHAGCLPQAPPWMQDWGLEWLFRFTQEPKRLWKRYMYLNPLYVTLIGLQMLRLRCPGEDDVSEPSVEYLYG